VPRSLDRLTRSKPVGDLDAVVLVEVAATDRNGLDEAHAPSVDEPREPQLSDTPTPRAASAPDSPCRISSK